VKPPTRTGKTTERLLTLLASGPKDCRTLGKAVQRSPYMVRAFLAHLARTGRARLVKRGTLGRYGMPSVWERVAPSTPTDRGAR
jgi:predicted ArsR family transcriptional regulator